MFNEKDRQQIGKKCEQIKREKKARNQIDEEGINFLWYRGIERHYNICLERKIDRRYGENVIREEEKELPLKGWYNRSHRDGDNQSGKRP